MSRNIAFGVAARLAAGAALIAAVGVVAGLSGAAPGSRTPATGSVTVIASWVGDKPGTEGWDFRQVLNAFTKQTGIDVHYTGTRALDQLLQSDIQQGSPPDLAMLPSPGELLQLEQQGYLHPLGPLLGPRVADYDPQWRDIMTLGTGQVYTLPVKADLQNLVWYDPRDWRAGTVPGEKGTTTWSELTRLEHGDGATARAGAAWCLGLDSPPTSGWPATDWIANILLAQSGTSYYERWANGTLPWTSPQVTAAWQTWGRLVTGPGQVYGGSGAAMISPWSGPQTTGPSGTGPEPLFTRRPGCYLQNAASFVTLEYQGGPNYQRPATGYDFFPFPSRGLPAHTPGTDTGAWEVSADLLAMFRDTPPADLPDTERLVQFLASPPAQRIWPAIRGGGAASADSAVPLGTYRDSVSQAVAGILTGTSATLCFNASDLMPLTLQDAFYQETMEYLQDPRQLKTILGRLDRERISTYAGFKPDFTCGSP